MSAKMMSQAELQHIEHCNKVLLDHLELVQRVTNETEGLLNTYLPILTTYVNSIIEVRQLFGKEVAHIVQSTRELSLVTNNTQPLINFIQATAKLNEALTPELTDKLKRVLQ